MSDIGATVALRLLGRADLPAALALQSASYPAFLVEDEAAFASRFDVKAPYCLAATIDGVLAGYLLAHGWTRQSPPAVGECLARDVPGEVLYIHDLAIGSAGRGRGIGRQLVAKAFQMAASDGIQTAELIAVEGASRYWQTLGFAQASTSAALRAKLATYGAEATWMDRAMGGNRPDL